MTDARDDIFAGFCAAPIDEMVAQAADPSAVPAPPAVTEDSEPDLRAWLAAIVDGSDDAIISKDLDGRIRTWNAGATRLFGYEAGEVIGRPVQLLIPEDRLGEEPTIISRIRAGQRVEHFETVRRRRDGSLVDISLSISPVLNQRGVVVGASKIARDITELRVMQEQQLLLMGEMQHRVKNLFALAAGIVSMSARAATDCESMAETIQSRLRALARAHDLTMPDMSGAPWTANDVAGNGVGLLSLVSAILEPYADADRIHISGCDVPVGRSALTSLALLLHELATNAAKYGALSTRDGRLEVQTREIGEQMELRWGETGGKACEPDARPGFGSRLERTVAATLGANISRNWRDVGLEVTFSMSRAALAI